MGAMREQPARGSRAVRLNVPGREPYCNAPAESFMKTMKHEEIYPRPYRTMDDVLRHLPTCLVHTYNEQRLHSALGAQSPAAVEAHHRETLSGQNQAAKLST